MYEFRHYEFNAMEVNTTNNTVLLNFHQLIMTSLNSRLYEEGGFYEYESHPFIETWLTLCRISKQHGLNQIAGLLRSFCYHYYSHATILYSLWCMKYSASSSQIIFRSRSPSLFSFWCYTFFYWSTTVFIIHYYD